LCSYCWSFSYRLPARGDEMVNWLGIVLGLGAALAVFIGLAAVSKYTGVDSYLIHMFSEVMDIIKRVFQFLVDHLPKPIKLVLFVLLFVLLGGTLYNLTLGATYVCYDQEVHNVDYVTGLMTKAVGALKSNTDTTDADPLKDKFEPDQEKFIQFDCDEVNCIQTTVTKEEADVLTMNSNVVQLDSHVVDDSGKVYEVTYGLRPLSSINSLEGYVGLLGNFKSLSLQPRDVAFQSFFGEKTQAFNVCYSPTFDTCILIQQEHFGDDACGTDDFAEFMTAGLVDADSGGPLHGWTSAVARIRYFMTEDGVGNFKDVEVDVRPTGGDIFTTWFQSLGIAPTLDDCELYDESDLQAGPGVEVLYKGTNQFDSSAQLEFTYDPAFGAPRTYSAPIYNAMWAPLFAVQVGDETVGFIDTQQESFDRAEKLAEIELQKTKVEQKSSDFVKFYCDKETADPNDTYMTVAGFNPFDGTTMLFIVLIGIVISVYGYMGVYK